jgi:hypothetical protein
MRAETVHVTDHALLRWKERAAKTEDTNVYEIIKAVKNSKVIKKNEPLPYPLPRLDGSVYSYNDGVLFVMEPITIDEYRLVTVICESAPYCGPAKPKTKAPKKEKIEPFDIPTFDSAIEERNWLVVEKRRLGNRAATGFVHVQPVVSRLSDLAAEGHHCLQLAAEPHPAA